MNNIEKDKDSNDILGEIYDEEVPDHAIVSKREFKPWHHPRKHWVRVKQLCRLAQSLIKESHFPDNVFKYLTLPGEELIDIQTLDRIAINGSEEILDIQAVEGIFTNIEKGKSLKLKYIGFNNVGSDRHRRATLELAQSTINDSERIHFSSRIENELVQAIANKNSKSYKVVKNNAPYNVINLDLCGSIANVSPNSGNNTYFNALIELLEIQRAHMAEPFLLLVATRTHPSDINQEALKTITEIYGSNLKDGEFKEIFESIIKEKAEMLLKRIADGENVNQDVLNKVFGVGLGKWLIHIMKPTPPFWDVILEDICCYSIGDIEKDNMLSVAFKFIKVEQPIQDKFGLAQSEVREGNLASESVLAKNMLTKSESITNVDDLLASDEITRNKLIRQTGSFLAKSGYSSEEYEKWANSKFQSIEGAA